MQLKNIILAAGVLGLASAQGSQGNQGNQGGQNNQGSPTNGMSPMPSGKSGKGGSGGVPSDLSGGFKVEDIQIEVIIKDGKKKKHHKGSKGQGQEDGNMASMTNMMPMPTSGGHKHHKGHKEVITIEEIQELPKFHLKKHNGATDQTKWIIVMVDTTQQDHRVMHYVHSDYMMSQNGSLMSTTQPQMAWMAPSKNDDSNPKHQYTFLMYSQQGNFQPKSMPQQGQAVNMSQWVQQNGLQKAIAGKSVAVDANANSTSGSNSTSSGSAPTGSPSVQSAKSVGSTLHVASAGVVGAVVAFGMALL